MGESIKIGERDDQAKVGYLGDCVGVEFRDCVVSHRCTTCSRDQISIFSRGRGTGETGARDKRYFVQLQRTRFPGI